ncbi:MAG: hypothetical protein JWO86_2793 [Myxococcaceae bacterium]|nr:hypothetical protein [Myxococcaceae bacterium]
MRTFLSAVAALAAAFTLFPLAGCSSSSAAKPAIEKTCVKTACDQRTAHDDQACSSCLDACSGASYTCNSSSACALSCGSSSECSDSERSQCVQQGFTVRVDHEPSAEVLAACNRAFDQLESCQLEIPGTDRSACALWAKAEKPETARLYDCVATKACTADDRSDCELPATTLGDDFCDALEAKCGAPLGVYCNGDDRKTLNDNGAWWREDVVALTKSCLSYPTCDDALECHLAWRTAVGF